MKTYVIVAIGCIGAAVACARADRSLPGDSVTEAGIVLSPPKLSTGAPEAPLGAIESKLFTPDVIMEHQAAIDVSAPQRDAILKEVDRGQTEIAHLQWDLQGEKEKLVHVLDADKVDETKAKDQAGRVMDDENRVKGAHLLMLVRIKNLLTADQQRKLRELRDAPRTRADAGPTNSMY